MTHGRSDEHTLGRLIQTGGRDVSVKNTCTQRRLPMATASANSDITFFHCESVSGALGVTSLPSQRVFRDSSVHGKKAIVLNEGVVGLLDCEHQQNSS
jgi:hypothetical protein